MSLTTFVERPNIKEAFDRLSNPDRKIKNKAATPLLVPDMKGPPGLAGTAFDYLARIHTERIFRGAKIKIIRRPWLSESALGRLSSRACDRAAFDSPLLTIWQVQALEEAHTCAYEYIDGGGCLRCLVRGVQHMAQSDLLMRGIETADSEFELSTRLSTELSDLLALFDPIELFAPKESIILNPAFPKGAEIGGADGDLIIDDRLIDIKTTVQLSLDKRHLLQLAGYAVLNELGGVETADGARTVPISKVGVYFARHRYLYEVPIADLFPNGAFNEFRKAFEEELESQTIKLAAQRREKQSSEWKEFLQRSKARRATYPRYENVEPKLNCKR